MNLIPVVSRSEARAKLHKNIQLGQQLHNFQNNPNHLKKYKTQKKQNVGRFKNIEIKNGGSRLKKKLKSQQKHFISIKENCVNHIQQTSTSHESLEAHNLVKSKINFSDMFFNISRASDKSSNSIQESQELFEWLLYPVKKDEFFDKVWEKTPLHIKRNKSNYFKNLISTPLIDKILREHHVLFTKNLDITSFTNNLRETYNPVGRAMPSIVWDYFLNGCSVRMLNPQVYVPCLHTVNATLQELFDCFVGANIYLTPPGSQGFAPHYDDIEAFVLQVEGKKRWKLYKPKDNNQFLPQYSSPDLSQNKLGKPVLETILNAGDVLYFPRGIIHQGDTINFEHHSLHITLSVYQKNSWGDFLKKVLPIALKEAITNNMHFRKGLPLHYLRHVGTVYSKNESSNRQKFLGQTNNLLSILFKKYLNVDKAADEMAKTHIYDFLPPILNKQESLCSVYEGGERMIKEGSIINRFEIEETTCVRLLRSHSIRLIEENGSHYLYYSTENSKEYHEYELQFLEIDLEFLPAVQELIVRFPQYIKVKDLPIDNLEKKIQIIRDLWEKAIVVTQKSVAIAEKWHMKKECI